MPTTVTRRQRQRRLEHEHAMYLSDPPENSTLEPSKSSPLSWTATISGPDKTPYENGTFVLSIQYPETYPVTPPSITFITKVYHPNIDSQTGFVGLNILHADWSPVLTISTILRSLQVLLSDPDPENAVMPEIANEFVMKKEEFDAIAREWTWEYAERADSGA